MVQNQQIGRRSFLSSTTALGAGLAIASNSLADENSTPSDELKIGLIGAGSQGRNLLNSCVKLPGIRIGAICDIWESFNLNDVAEIARRHGHEAATYTDYQEFLSKQNDIDAVLIATPDFCHADQTIACLKAGLHVYCEAPMANTIEGAKRMALAAKESGKLLQIGQQRRSNPRYQFCEKRILKQSKLLGKLSAANAQWNRSVLPSRGWPRRAPLEDPVLTQYGYTSMPQFRDWRWYRDLGTGPIGELGVHQIDIFNWFIGSNPKSVIASGGTDYYSADTHECYDTVMAVFEYEWKGKTVRALYQTINSNSNFGYYEALMGDEGTLHISETEGTANVYREPAAISWGKWVDLGILVPPPEPEKSAGDTEVVLDIHKTVRPDQYTLPVAYDKSVTMYHLENFFDSIRGKARLSCPPETGYGATVAALKIYDAINSGKKIEFNPDEFKV